MRDYSLELLISRILRIGITLASVLGGIGGAWYLDNHGSRGVSYAIFHETSSAVLSPGETVRSIFHSHAQATGERELAVVQLGILLLLATPVMRVAFSIVGFALERDETYVMITSIVLLTLLVSIFLL